MRLLRRWSNVTYYEVPRSEPLGGAEKRRATAGQSEHCSSPVAAIAAKVELRSDRC
ncbi:hypothetical protein FHR99_003001 [Litorivivens lipolytica]|uniref:Uncharacterized protein n=1 Tax=Litorivivens lipolytica TaxID=1524264 RepID=A0A7W4W778_9GAMM|nr:hypothetical protein [Litorivivens lipolytica]